ncbi:polyprenyl synthetase family protein [Streptomyces sp. URMC 123]|uniref:polyprenyl synthetase family protein n=1 Tax=Streptomyces sp. URMC 123 TaxID=3423403 RepID=UPI003F1A76C6
MTALTSAPLDPARTRKAVDAALAEFLERQQRSTAHRPISRMIDALRSFLFAGGKRIRPAMCLCGWQAAGGRGDIDPVIRTAASLELFHAFTLIHDDIMDNSATRRGRPSAHRALAAWRRGRGGRGHGSGAGDRFGVNAAILLGDLALAWSDEMLQTAGLTPGQLRAVLPVLHTMRTEVMQGQYLDLLSTGRLTGDIDLALTVVRYKSAKYTVERPLHLGAALAGPDPSVMDACTAYALPIGEAFQLRDDLLGVFGDTAATGKPVIDDLREGKSTVLMSLAVARADAAQLRLLHRLVGDPTLEESQAAAVRAVLEETHARQDVEHMIATRYREALRALDRAPFPSVATAALRRLADAATARTH